MMWEMCGRKSLLTTPRSEKLAEGWLGELNTPRHACRQTAGGGVADRQKVERSTSQLDMYRVHEELLAANPSRRGG